MLRMIDRYMEMQSSYIHERRQVDLIEHLWAVKGNKGEWSEVKMFFFKKKKFIMFMLYF